MTSFRTSTAALFSVARLNVFIGPDSRPEDLPAAGNGNGWVLRAYDSLDGLSLLADQRALGPKPMPVRWSLTEHDRFGREKTFSI